MRRNDRLSIQRSRRYGSNLAIRLRGLFRFPLFVVCHWRELIWFLLFFQGDGFRFNFSSLTSNRQMEMKAVEAWSIWRFLAKDSSTDSSQFLKRAEHSFSFGAERPQWLLVDTPWIAIWLKVRPSSSVSSPLSVSQSSQCNYTEILKMAFVGGCRLIDMLRLFQLLNNR